MRRYEIKSVVSKYSSFFPQRYPISPEDRDLVGRALVEMVARELHAGRFWHPDPQDVGKGAFWLARKFLQLNKEMVMISHGQFRCLDCSGLNKDYHMNCCA